MGRDNPAEPKQLSIRIAWDLRQQLQRVANENGRSLNSEIVRRLMYTLDLDSVKDNSHGYIQEKTGSQPEQMDSETGDSILHSLNTINTKLDYITSESYSKTSFLSLVKYLSRKL